jgi:hypothetical protein
MWAPLIRGCNAAVEEAVARTITPLEFAANERAEDEYRERKISAICRARKESACCGNICGATIEENRVG